jgi:hypothetical protein
MVTIKKNQQPDLHKPPSSNSKTSNLYKNKDIDSSFESWFINWSLSESEHFTVSEFHSAFSEWNSFKLHLRL